LQNFGASVGRVLICVVYITKEFLSRMSDLFRNVQVEMSHPYVILTSIKIEKEVNLLTKGVLYELTPCPCG
jgi:hypothetical protein